MSAPRWSCFVLLLVLCDGGWSWREGHWESLRSHDRQVFSYPRDWDTDWSQRGQWQSDWQAGDPVPEYDYQVQDQPADTIPDYQPRLRPRVEMFSNPKVDTRGLWHSQQRGSAVIPYEGATVRVKPNPGTKKKFYRGVVTSTIFDGPPPKRRGHKKRHKNKGGQPGRHLSLRMANADTYDSPVNLVYPPYLEHHQFLQDEPAHAKVCARCPSDRALLAKKGSNTVLMEAPPIIPCQPWSSIEKVKAEIVAGPQPGSQVPEGSHKIVIRLYRHRRTLATCITRYNVIVRKCPELEVGLAVKADCPLGKAWGGHCNITCDRGYDLEGDSDTECTDDLEWSGVMPQCIPSLSCPVLSSPENGQLSCRTPLHKPVLAEDMMPDGSLCQYLCAPGYTIPPAQEHLAQARCVAGSWDNDQDPICIETNELEEEEPPPEIPEEEALRFDAEDCPEDFCMNGGQCIMILNDPLCSCRTGFSGPNCEDFVMDGDPAESNTIT